MELIIEHLLHKSRDPESVPRYMRGMITVTHACPAPWDLMDIPVHSAANGTHCSKTAEWVAYWLTDVARFLPEVLQAGVPLSSFVFPPSTTPHLLVFDIIAHKFAVVVRGSECILLQSDVGVDGSGYSLTSWIASAGKVPGCNSSLGLRFGRDRLDMMLATLQQAGWAKRQELECLFGKPYTPFNPSIAKVAVIALL